MARGSARNSRVYIDVSSAANGSASAVSFLSNWTISQQFDQIEVTSFGDGSKTYVPGLPDASGGFDGFINLGTATFSTLCDGNARKMYLYPDVTNAASTYWFGTVYISADYEGAVDGALMVKLKWSAASTLTMSATGV